MRRGGWDFTTQFTCFTGTKVQMLTPEELQGGEKFKSTFFMMVAERGVFVCERESARARKVQVHLHDFLLSAVRWSR